MRGEILLAQSNTNVAVAEDTFRRAVAPAAKQSCRALELRAATSLAKLLGHNGRDNEARDVLAPVHAAFTNGFDRPDLIAAKTLLAELNEGAAGRKKRRPGKNPGLRRGTTLWDKMR